MKEVFLILKAEVARNWVQIKRYPLEPITNAAALFILFMIIVSGFKPTENSTGVADFNKTVAGAIIGYVMWFFVIMALSNFSNRLEEEAKLGTLEQLCMASRGLTWVISSRVVADFFYSLFVIATLFLLLAASTRVSLNLQPSLLVPVALTICAVYGFGFIIGALSLLLKRTGEIRSIVQILFLFLAIVPLDNLPSILRIAVLVLPLNIGLEAMRSIAVESRALTEPEMLRQVILMTVNSALYLTVGVLVFRRAERVAYTRGLLAHY